MPDHDRDDSGDDASIARLTASCGVRRPTVPDSHADLLAAVSVAHLSSLGHDGAPQAHPVWFDADDGQLLVSTGTDRQKYRNVRRDPRVSVSILDPGDPYRYLEVRGRVVEIEPDPGSAFLDRLAWKYLGQATYPYPQRRGVERVVLRVRPEHVVSG